MKIDLNSGTFFRVGGELGKYNSLPISSLIKIAQDFQDLILTIAKYDLPSTEAINLNNFILELVGFSKGSAVPKFAFSPRSENMTGFHWREHRNTVNEKFERLVEISSIGDYRKIIELYPEPAKRNPIVENLYSFVNAFGSSPVSIVEFDEQNGDIKPIFKLNRFKTQVKNELITKIIDVPEYNNELTEGVGKLKIITKRGKTTRRIIDAYSGAKYSLEYAPDNIVFEDIVYRLQHPLRCYFAKEDDYYIIQSELLGIIGTGRNEDEAERSFAEEFDYLYKKLQSLNSKQLTRHNMFIKNLFSHIVENIEK